MRRLSLTFFLTILTMRYLDPRKSHPPPSLLSRRVPVLQPSSQLPRKAIFPLPPLRGVLSFLFFFSPLHSSLFSFLAFSSAASHFVSSFSVAVPPLLELRVLRSRCSSSFFNRSSSFLSCSSSSAFRSCSFSAPSSSLSAASFSFQILCGYLLVSDWVSQNCGPEVVEKVFGVGAVLRFSKSNATPSGVFNKTKTR